MPYLRTQGVNYFFKYKLTHYCAGCAKYMSVFRNHVTFWTGIKFINLFYDMKTFYCINGFWNIFLCAHTWNSVILLTGNFSPPLFFAPFFLLKLIRINFKVSNWIVFFYSFLTSIEKFTMLPLFQLKQNMSILILNKHFL